MLSKRLAVLFLAGAFAVSACNDSTGLGNASEEDREEILELLQESGFFDDGFGLDGASEGSAPAAGTMALVDAADAAEVEAPRVWGRRRGLPVRRLITVDVDPDAGTASVSKEIFFEGDFLLDITRDEQFNPTRKPLVEKLVQYATFRRVPVEQADEKGRRWRLIDASPAEFLMTDELKRTVSIVKVEVWVNEELKTEITDPSALIEVEGRLPKLHPEDHILVRAWVENSLENDNVPDTFVFMHLFHASPNMRAWLRLPMEKVVTDTDEYYEMDWRARHTGRSRIAIDAIDAETFTTETEDDYRSNIWGIPYRIVTPDVATQ